MLDQLLFSEDGRAIGIGSSIWAACYAVLPDSRARLADPVRVDLRRVDTTMPLRGSAIVGKAVEMILDPQVDSLLRRLIAKHKGDFVAAWNADASECVSFNTRSSNRSGVTFWPRNGGEPVELTLNGSQDATVATYLDGRALVGTDHGRLYTVVEETGYTGPVLRAR
jgi:hypothetical protein